MAGKVLFCATVDYHFKAFHLPYMQWFKDQGWKVDVAAKGDIELPFVDSKYNIPIQRSPFSKGNFAAYKQLKSIMDQEQYDLIHCHTPVGGMMARLAARASRKHGTKVIYTAHGFHFCKGAPLLNWMIYYPIEKAMSQLTDCLITINHEDYELSQKRFKLQKIEHVRGVGVDTNYFKPITEQEKFQRKQSFGYKPNDFLLFYAAEFNRNKNQRFLLHSLALMSEKRPDIKLLLAGEGPLLKKCKELAEELGISGRVRFLGFEKDIRDWIQLCDVAVASSDREGLPVNVMESMACGLPVVAVNNRGHRELVQNNVNGWLVEPDDHVDFNRKVIMFFDNEEIRQQFGEKGRQIIISTYSIPQVLTQKSAIYESFMEKEGVKWMAR
ncbi:glycosyltransferase family 1 protein [Jeotgalibacillus sp. S-D1]|uniref:glycosyltransferase family 4 protein n=1 Tax=Jeotgalibacillus sp. S-D1 TaxID=2552189 RepID=UPI00105A8639|nr:glycosyltransferase family 4 protein [Jeotgalibacillus sp. S-D1]TDL31826.1 glycosyltransferase family 1 protein [Jeotgalibacillus sp. S-D1]